MIDDSANPLAEVALALAMAFFSLMVLTLFAVVHQPEHSAVDTAVIAQSSSKAQTKPQTKAPMLVILHETGLYDDMLRPIDASDLPIGQPITLAVRADFTVAEMMRFQQVHKELDVQISALTPKWTELLRAKNGSAK